MFDYTKNDETLSSIYSKKDDNKDDLLSRYSQKEASPDLISQYKSSNDEDEKTKSLFDFSVSKDDDQTQSGLFGKANFLQDNTMGHELNIRGSNYSQMDVIDKMRGIQSSRLNVDTDSVSLAEGYYDETLDKRVMNGLYNVTLSDVYNDKRKFMAVHGLYTDGIIEVEDSDNSLQGDIKDKKFTFISEVAENSKSQNKEIIEKLEQSIQKETKSLSFDQKSLTPEELFNQNHNIFDISKLENSSQKKVDFDISDLEKINSPDFIKEIEEEIYNRRSSIDIRVLELLPAPVAHLVKMKLLENLERQLIGAGIEKDFLQKLFNSPVAGQLFALVNSPTLIHDLELLLIKNRNYFKKEDLEKLYFSKTLSKKDLKNLEDSGRSFSAKDLIGQRDKRSLYEKISDRFNSQIEIDIDKLSGVERDLSDYMKNNRSSLAKDAEDIIRKISSVKIIQDAEKILKKVKKKKVSLSADLEGFISIADVQIDELEKVAPFIDIEKPKKKKRKIKTRVKKGEEYFLDVLNGKTIKTIKT